MKYYYPHGIVGSGSDIGWCGKWKTGKKCLMCKQYSAFDVWSKEWKWHYLIRWADFDTKYYQTYSHFNLRVKMWPSKNLYNPTPGRYGVTGLKETDIKNLLKKGCKVKRKCKCINIAQRGSWYCKQCWSDLKKMSVHKKVNIHDLIICDTDELKKEILILKLSGTL